MPLSIKDLMPSNLEFQMFVLDELADELTNKGADVIKLTIGVTELPIPENVLERMIKRLRDPDFVRRVYPEGLPELREAIANFYNNSHGTNVSLDNVIVNTGSSPIFRNLFQLLAGPEFEIMIPRPYYALYLYCAKLAGAKVKFYDIDVNTKRVDMDSFRRNFSPERTSLVVINSPGNPVGNIVNPQEMREMYEIINHQAYVVNDEIYNNTMFYEPFHTPLAVLPEHNDITIVTNSFSKGYRMYTKRVGFAILPEQLQKNLRVMQQHTLLCTDPCYQDGMIAALEDEESPARNSIACSDPAPNTRPSACQAPAANPFLLKAASTPCCVARTGSRHTVLHHRRSWHGTFSRKFTSPLYPEPILVYPTICGSRSATLATMTASIGCERTSPNRHLRSIKPKQKALSLPKR